MSFQQSINQMLIQSGIVGGLYSQTPQGKAYAKQRTLDKTYGKAYDEGLASNVDIEKGTALASEIYQLNPTEETSNQEAEWSGRLQKAQEDIRKSKQKYEMRKKLLSAEPEVKRQIKEKIILGGNI